MTDLHARASSPSARTADSGGASYQPSLSSVLRLLDLMPEAFVVRNAEDRIIYWNKGAETLYGYTAEEALNRCKFTLLKTEFPYALDSIRKTLQEDGIWSGELTHSTKQGTQLLVQARWTLDPDDNSVLETITNITQQRAIEKTLRDQGELLANIVDRIPVMVSIYDPRLKGFQFNKYFRDALGWTEKDSGREDFLEKVYPEPRHRQRMIDFMLSGSEGWLDTEVTAKDGRKVISSWANIRLSNDTQIGIGIDLRERERQARALRESEERYRGLFENMVEGFFLADLVTINGVTTDIRFLEANPAFEELTGIRRKEMLGRKLSEVIPGAALHWASTCKQVAKTGKPAFISEYSQALGRHFETVIYRSSEGKIAGIFNDITDRMRWEEELNRATALLKAISDNTGDAIFAKDREGRLSFANPATLELVGKTAEQTIGKTDRELLLDQAAARTIMENDRRVMLSGKGEEIEEFVPMPDGTRRIWLSRKVPYRDSENTVIGLLGISRDITERKKEEIQLLHLSQQRQLALDAAQMGWWHYDPQADILCWDNRYQEIFQLSNKECGDEAILSRIHPEDLPSVRKKIDQAMNPANPIPFQAEFRILLPEETIRWIEAYGAATFEDTPKGRISVSFVGAAADITRRKDTEDALRKANQRLKNVLDSITDGLAVISHDWKFTYFSDQAGRLIGIKPEELLGRDLWDAFPAAKELKFGKYYQLALETNKAVHFEEYYPEPLNQWLECHCYPSSEGLSVFFRNINEKKRAEQELREAQDKQLFFATALQKSSQPFVVGFPDGEFMVYNKAFATLTGYSLDELKDQNWSKNLTPLEWRTKEAEILKVLHQTGEPQTYEKEYIRKNGERIPVEIKVHLQRNDEGDIAYYYAFLTDLTERKRAQEALIRTEKLASAGKLAAAIAHEVNNPLEAVTNSIFLAKITQGNPETTQRYLEMADAELQRIAHITKQSLGFYRESTTPSLCNLTNLIDMVFDILRAKVNQKQANVEKDCPEDLRIETVPGELRQILANLVGNSLDAIDRKGTVKVRASRVFLKQRQQQAVRIIVADNGAGIPENIRTQIFEPFFTTKGTVGTGLGLWVARQLIEKHNGAIRVRSCHSGPEQGTAIVITLPEKHTTERT